MATAIEWTDETWNPLAGCREVSPGCRNCYAVGMAHRLAAMAEADIADGRDPGRKRHYIGLTEKRGSQVVWTGKINLIPEALADPLGWKKPRRVFVNSMSDLFHEAVPMAHIADVFAAMYEAQWHTFQVLTKRPEQMASILSNPRFPWAVGVRAHARLPAKKADVLTQQDLIADVMDRWPLPNVWLGTTVENQEQADKRIPHLLKCPAAVRFLSCEPLLGPVDLSSTGFEIDLGRDLGAPVTTNLHWVIVGGESGHHARPMHPDWARSLRDQSLAAGVPFFFKQHGEFIHSSQLPYELSSPTPGTLNYANRPGAWLQPEIVKLVFRHRKADQSQFDEKLVRDGQGGVYARVGKKAAGRELDGRTWDEFPEVTNG